MKIDRLKVARWLQIHSPPFLEGFVTWWCARGPWRIFMRKEDVTPEMLEHWKQHVTPEMMEEAKRLTQGT